MQNDFQFLEMDDLVNGSHHNKSLENIHDLSDSSFINSNQERYLRRNEHFSPKI